jgi:hypothetical protein
MTRTVCWSRGDEPVNPTFMEHETCHREGKDGFTAARKIPISAPGMKVLCLMNDAGYDSRGSQARSGWLPEGVGI